MINQGGRDVRIDESDLKLIRLTQDGIELVPNPFKEIADELGVSEDEVTDRIESLIERGIIRRFGASIGHRTLGIVANAMCAWNVPDERTEEVGAVMAGFDEVSHCYERMRYPEWDYNLYTMIHARTREECEHVAHEISRATAISDYTILFSEREFKKTGVRI
ncbi:MAG: putative HTH-type transcriptional regulator [Candidatus Methanogasteraceae archaeon]|nr:MAG: putative HTH-type transcriptional regulator [ANME-2 cluster archaeon]